MSLFDLAQLDQSLHLVEDPAQIPCRGHAAGSGYYHNQHHQHQYDPCDHGNCHHRQDPDSSSSGFQRLLDERQLSFCQHTLYRLHFDKVLTAYISFRNIYQEIS